MDSKMEFRMAWTIYELCGVVLALAVNGGGTVIMYYYLYDGSEWHFNRECFPVMQNCTRAHSPLDYYRYIYVAFNAI